jgi:hypothetical protein
MVTDDSTQHTGQSTAQGDAWAEAQRAINCLADAVEAFMGALVAARRGGDCTVLAERLAAVSSALRDLSFAFAKCPSVATMPDALARVAWDAVNIAKEGPRRTTIAALGDVPKREVRERIAASVPQEVREEALLAVQAVIPAMPPLVRRR